MFEPSIALVLAALSCLLGFSWLALAMNVHWQQVMATGSAPSAKTRRTLRMLGGLALLLSAMLCFVADRPSMAVLVWFMFLAAGAPFIGMMLTWRPQWLRVVWPAASIKRPVS